MKYAISGIRLLFLGLFIFLITRGMMNIWLVLLGVSLIAELVFGRIYCGYVCPMNTVMVPTEWIAKKLKLKTKEAPKWLASGKIGWISLVVSLAVMMLGKRVLGKNIPVLLIWLGVSIVVTLIYKPYVFHNLLCPFGAVQKLFSKNPKFSERVDESKCNGCTLCERVCPSKSIEVNKVSKLAIIDHSLCLQCTNCQQICPKDAIKYTSSN